MALVVGAGFCLAGTAQAAYAAPGAGVIHTIRSGWATGERSPESRPTGYYGLTEVCLDADTNTMGRDGTKVQLWECNDSAQQDWYYEPVNSSEAVIKNRRAGSGYCLDADLNTIGRNGTKVQLWQCNGTPQELWRGFGDINMKNVKAGTGFCLDADLNTIHSNGTRVQLWGCNGSNQQEWGMSVPYTQRCKTFSVGTRGSWQFAFPAGSGAHVDVYNASLSSANITVTSALNGETLYHGVLGVNQGTTFHTTMYGTPPLSYTVNVAVDGSSIRSVGFVARSYVC
ncbi:RICIN domain-containing protein [Nonomuraea angiospora]|uniref:RICIN domain-containing protein n=1 Tax=Nonomuraea angiospora TaxID=46172 RepID=UPI00344FF505